MQNTLDNVFSKEKLFLLAGPCAIENETITLQTAEFLKELTDRLDIPYVFKASYRKANRTKSSS
ncbi:MAG: 3-deoxy-8-phosphooctulonate synthase, partial [Bacteroidia bacterium]|nr:3-deoxy-8-phosphooctulonate synthase [Bacteroidia bacterium]